MLLNHRYESINPWAAWIVLHVFGGIFGVIFGEILGLYAAQSLTLAAGHLVAFLVFELAIWLPRRLMFQWLMFDTSLTHATQWKWLAAEFVGWMIGTQLSQNMRDPHFADGAAFGAVLSAIMWFLLWCMQRIPYGKWWIVAAVLFACAGFVVASRVVAATLVFNGLHNVLPHSPFAWMVSVLSGVLAGLVIGGVTSVFVVSQHAAFTLFPRK